MKTLTLTDADAPLYAIAIAAVHLAEPPRTAETTYLTVKVFGKVKALGAAVDHAEFKRVLSAGGGTIEFEDDEHRAFCEMVARAPIIPARCEDKVALMERLKAL